VKLSEAVESAKRRGCSPRGPDRYLGLRRRRRLRPLPEQHRAHLPSGRAEAGGTAGPGL